MNNKKVLRPQTDIFYNSAEELAEAIKSEKVYAKHLNKNFDALTTAERRRAVDFKPLKEEKQAPKKTNKALEARENK